MTIRLFLYTFTCTSLVCAQELKSRPPEVIQAEILDTEKKLAELKQELAKASKQTKINWNNLNVGDSGFGENPNSSGVSFEVVSIISENKMIARNLTFKDKHFILVGKQTSGLADGKAFGLKLLVKVTGTEKINGTTFYVVELQKVDPKK